MNFTLSKPALIALERKYRALAELRKQRESYEAEGIMALIGDERDARQGAMKKVASEFPGALRELESLSANELLARAKVIAALSRSGEPLPMWVALVWELHCITKGMLLIKETGKRKRIEQEEWKQLEWFRSVDVETINRYLSPQSRRMVDEIWGDLSLRFGKPVDELQALFKGGE